MKEFTKEYYKLLTEDYSGINLTRITNPIDFKVKQIDDSIAPIEAVPNMLNLMKSADYVVDVGFGGGFPILPLAKKLPSVKFIGVETRRKKVDVVSEIAAKLELKNVQLIHQRIENIYFDKKVVFLFKAVGTISKFHPCLNSAFSTTVFYYKAKSLFELESESLKEKAVKVHKVEVASDIERYIVEVPLNLRNQANNLVKLSSII